MIRFESIGKSSAATLRMASRAASKGPPGLREVARSIDHSLLHPTITDRQVADGCDLARRLDVASVTVKPANVRAAVERIGGSGVAVATVAGFPHGSSTTSAKAHESAEGLQSGAAEIELVINIGKTLGGDWGYVADEIRAVNDVVTGTDGALLKVVFETDYLQDAHIIRLCALCSRIGVAFVATSTSYGFVRQPDGNFSYRGATDHHLMLMREHLPPSVSIKASGGIRTLEDILRVRSLGATRVGCSATAHVLEEAAARFGKSGVGLIAEALAVKASDAIEE
jgi:deoxyribose-phosphate aldolase